MRHRSLGTMAVMFDAPFALTLAARALGADEESARRSAAARTFTPAHEGALALLCAQAAILACAPSPPPIVRAVTDRLADATEAIASDTLVLWPWRVTVGMDAGEVSLLLDARALFHTPESSGNVPHIAGDLSVAVELIAARDALPATELSALAIGDVLALEGTLSIEMDSATLSGDMIFAMGEVEVPVTVSGSTVTIAAPARTRRVSVNTDQDARTPPEAQSEERRHENSEQTAVRTELLTTLPVETEVVIARGTFTVGEISSWRVGEVITLHCPIGEPVLVRAGGRSVARGELCNVEGEVGVRITELL